MQNHSLVISNVRYLKQTKDGQSGLQGFCDTDWASQEHHHSISSYVFMIDGGAVSWSSEKQSLVSLSTTEAEYISLMHAAKEALWIQTFLVEIARPLCHPTTLFCDNQSAIAILKNTQYHACTKHIDIRHHLICDCMDCGAILVKYCPTAENTADLFTKALPAHKLKGLTLMMVLHSA